MKNSQKKSKLDVLTNQIRRLDRRLSRLKNLSRRFSNYRLVIFFAGVGFGAPIFWVNHLWSYSTFLVMILVFNIIAYFHRKVERSVLRYDIFLDIKKSQLARKKLDWQNIPQLSVFPADEKHFFEIDLNITGKNSLHQLIDISVSESGSRRLLDWLLSQTPDLNIIEKRQLIIKELKPLNRFRDRLLLNFRLVSKQRLEDSRLSRWLENVVLNKNLKTVLRLSVVLALINWALFLGYLLLGLKPYFIGSFVVYSIIYLMNDRLCRPIFDEAEFLLEEIKKFKTIFKFLESFYYGKNSNLKKFCSIFVDQQDKPSVQIKNLVWVTIAIGLRMNYLLGLILNIACPWDFLFAFQLNVCKLKFKDKFPHWMNTCFDLEALVSIANFAYLNPEYNLPEFAVQNTANPIFEAVQLGHPLIPFDIKKFNDFSLFRLGEIVLITGSNMSGKSTFLRTIGINLSLAYAGAPVNANRLKISLFRVFTCINVNDSIIQGVSQFYAEVKQLRELLNQLERKNESPLLFLIDEIYKGTNNRERLLGSRAFIRALFGKNGLGIISTHDLELTELEKEFANFRNYHFREDVQNGKMVFDYLLRPGPCPTTNALRIMELEGLPVNE